MVDRSIIVGITMGLFRKKLYDKHVLPTQDRELVVLFEESMEDHNMYEYKNTIVKIASVLI